jgi:hypothetical protein
MAVTIKQEEDNIRVLRITGTIVKSEFDAVITTEAKQWGPQTEVKLLVLAEDFQGWERNEEWGDLSFFLKYGDQIGKIAIVADPNLETDLLMFTAAGFRRAPVKFFPMWQIASARAWIEEKA